MFHDRHYHWKVWNKGFGIAARIFFGLIGAVLLAFVFGYFVQLLWNWIMPDIFNLGKIDYWQGFGIVLLARLVFGSLGHNHDYGYWKRMEYYRRRREWEYDWDLGWGSEWRINGGYKQWKYYKDYWRDEGKTAFEHYLEKRRQAEESKKEDK